MIFTFFEGWSDLKYPFRFYDYLLEWIEHTWIRHLENVKWKCDVRWNKPKPAAKQLIPLKEIGGERPTRLHTVHCLFMSRLEFKMALSTWVLMKLCKEFFVLKIVLTLIVNQTCAMHTRSVVFPVYATIYKIKTNQIAYV